VFKGEFHSEELRISSHRASIYRVLLVEFAGCSEHPALLKCLRLLEECGMGELKEGGEKAEQAGAEG
jgi:hypothetical protein